MIEFHNIGSLFQSKEKKQMFVDLDGVLWVNGNLVCAELEFKNTARTIAYHVEESDRCKVDVDALNDAWFVSESGLWTLALASKSEKAKEFRRMLTRDILPNIRKNGYYIAPAATAPQLQKMQLDILHHANWSQEDWLASAEYNRSEVRALYA